MIGRTYFLVLLGLGSFMLLATTLLLVPRMNALGEQQGLFKSELAEDLQLQKDLLTCNGELLRARSSNIADKVGCLVNQRAEVRYYLYEIFPLPPGSKEPEPEELGGLCEHQEHYSALRDGTRAAGEGLFAYKNRDGQLFLACKWVQDAEPAPIPTH